MVEKSLTLVAVAVMSDKTISFVEFAGTLVAWLSIASCYTEAKPLSLTMSASKIFTM